MTPFRQLVGRGIERRGYTRVRERGKFCADGGFRVCVGLEDGFGDGGETSGVDGDELGVQLGFLGWEEGVPEGEDVFLRLFGVFLAQCRDLFVGGGRWLWFRLLVRGENMQLLEGGGNC